MRVVVTGATGNIGSALLPELARQVEVNEIVGVARRLPSTDGTGVCWERAAVESDDLRSVFRGADVVVHLVWIIQPSHDPERQRIVNVIGTERVLAAAADAGVGAVVHASSVGAYSPGPRDRFVDESWPTDGNAGLAYSWQKAYVERVLDRFEREHPSTRVVRMRPALVMQRMAGSEVKRYFVGRLVPAWLVPGGSIVRALERGPLQLQAVHATDVARAFALAVVGALARVAEATYRARLQPTSAGWVRTAAGLPLMDTARIRNELGWRPHWTARGAVADLLTGMREQATGPTPALA